MCACTDLGKNCKPVYATRMFCSVLWRIHVKWPWRHNCLSWVVKAKCIYNVDSTPTKKLGQSLWGRSKKAIAWDSVNFFSLGHQTLLTCLKDCSCDSSGHLPLHLKFYGCFSLSYLYYLFFLIKWTQFFGRFGINIVTTVWYWHCYAIIFFCYLPYFLFPIFFLQQFAMSSWSSCHLESCMWYTFQNRICG